MKRFQKLSFMGRNILVDEIIKLSEALNVLTLMNAIAASTNQENASEMEGRATKQYDMSKELIAKWLDEEVETF